MGFFRLVHSNFRNARQILGLTKNAELRNDWLAGSSAPTPLRVDAPRLQCQTHQQPSTASLTLPSTLRLPKTIGTRSAGVIEACVDRNAVGAGRRRWRNNELIRRSYGSRWTNFSAAVVSKSAHPLTLRRSVNFSLIRLRGFVRLPLIRLHRRTPASARVHRCRDFVLCQPMTSSTRSNDCRINRRLPIQFRRKFWNRLPTWSHRSSPNCLIIHWLLDISQSCPWVHFLWPNPTRPINWQTQPNPTHGKLKNLDPTQPSSTQPYPT